jgi:DNA-binding HxlR family transcriptional regulator
MARTNRYDHFCPVARSLEVIGEKWSLLIVRDLLGGPKRFSDLQRGLANITPKWLTLRLRELESAGLVEREQEEGRREVWYQLTPRGRDLSPVIGALNVWGLQHAVRPPHRGEAILPGRVVDSFAGYLNTTGLHAPDGTAWRFILDAQEEDISFIEGRWRLRPAAAPTLRITARLEDWANMLSQSPDRPSPQQALRLEGTAAERSRFAAALDSILEPEKAKPGTRRTRAASREQVAPS